jgi:small-conductance mechanosensitive channel
VRVYCTLVQYSRPGVSRAVFRRCFLRTCAVVGFLSSWGLEARAQPQTPPAAAQPASTQGVLSEQVPATVMVWNRPVAVFRAPYASRDPGQRAEAAAARIESALDGLIPEEIRYDIVQSGTDRAALILSGAGMLFAILEGDLPQDTARSLETAGAQAVDRLQAVLRERAEQRQWRVLLRSTVEALLATVAFAAIWLASRRALQWLRGRLTRAAARRIMGAAIAGIDPRPLVFATLGWLIRVVELAVRLAAAYLWLTFVLSRFAYSRPWGLRLGGFLIDTVTRMAAAVVDHLPNLITLAIILFVTRTIAAAAGAWFRAVERGDLPVSWIDPIAARAARRLGVLAIWLFAITVAYPYVPGANTDAFKGVSVFLGLVVSLGSVGVVGQIMGGLFVLFNRALRPGDVVKVGDVHGVVKDLGIVSITVSTRTQEEVTIPNSVVVADAIRNFSRAHAGAVVLSTSVTIGYDAPWRQVHAMLLLAAARTDGVLREPAPVVYATTLSDFYVEYELVAHGAASVARSALLSKLHEQILDVFNEHGVQIMSPHFEGQPEKPAIVERSKWFADPAEKTTSRTQKG